MEFLWEICRSNFFKLLKLLYIVTEENQLGAIVTEKKKQKLGLRVDTKFIRFT